MRRALPLLSGLLLVLTLLPAAAPAQAIPRAPARADQVDIPIPDIEWSDDCYEDAECAVVRLPLDYDDADGPKTPINVLKVPATGRRIGSLFVNPGGPGGSAFDFAAYARRYLGREIARRFDIIGVEPRGVGVNRPAWCRAGTVAHPPTGYPIGARQERRWIRADRSANRGCAADRSPVVDHMSTADYARDIDVIRQAVGDEQLTFYGVSYGSIVGQTYAAMFPDRVRAVVVDGVLDPVGWTAGRRRGVPSTYRIQSGKGAYEALISALNECDRVSRARCALSGEALETWRRTYRLAAQGKLKIDGWRLQPQDLVGAALGSLYDARSIRYLVRFLERIDRLSEQGTTVVTASAKSTSWDQLQRIVREREEAGPYGVAVPSHAPGFARNYNSFSGVLCSDAVNPDNPGVWRRYSRIADRKQPWFGRLWTWASSLCAGWVGKGGRDAFRGPWPTRTSTPLLVVGNTHDPATPISGARAANRIFKGSVLLTLDTWGHGAMGGVSDCVTSKVADYLIRQRLPRSSAWCRPDVPLFPPPRG